MLYFIFGEDSFRSQRYFLKVKEFYQKETVSFFNYDFTDKTQSPPELITLEDIIKSKTLFSNSRLIIIKNFFQGTNIELRRQLLEILKRHKVDQVKDLMIIFYENAKVSSDSLQKWIKQKSSGEKEFALLKYNELAKWIIKEEQKLGLRLTLEARKLLSFSFSSDTGSIYHSLKKLSLIKKGQIDKDFLEANLYLPMSSTIFNFLDYLTVGNNEKAFWLLEVLINQGMHPLQILKMIIFQIRNLLIIKESMGRPASMHPYTYSKLLPLSRAISLGVLQEIYQDILFYDQKIKGGNLDASLGLEMLLVDFFNKRCHTQEVKIIK